MSLLKTVLLLFLAHAFHCQSQILITELMVDPSPSHGLPEYEYIELTNFGQDFVDLSNWELSDKSKRVTLPNFVASPGAIILITKKGTFSSLSDIQNHIEIDQIPSLNNSGDLISLISSTGDTADIIDYTSVIDGSKEGFSLELINPLSHCLGGLNWAYSTNDLGGTPGHINSVNTSKKPNPQFSHFNISETGEIQLYPINPESITNAWVDINNQALELSFDSSNKYMRGDLSNHLSNSIGTEFGLHISNCIGTVLDTFLVFGIPSMAGPKSILINEIMFNPAPEAFDFIELYNNSNKIIDLSTLFLKSDNKQHFLSSSQRMFYPNELIALTKDRSSLEFEYPSAIPTRILETPLPPLGNDAGEIILCQLNGDSIDYLHYESEWHHPLVHDDEGVSLERISWDKSTQSPDNWHSASSSSGYATPTQFNSQATSGNSGEERFQIHPTTVTPNLDGDRDFLTIQFHLEKPGYLSTIRVFDLTGNQLAMIINNQLVGISDQLNWEPTVDGALLQSGIYIIHCEIHHPSGENERFKKSFIIARN